MSDLSSAAKANLESARQSDGKFGTQPHSNPGQLSGLTGPAAEVLDDLRTLSEAEQEAFGFRYGTHPENLAVEDLDDEVLDRALRKSARYSTALRLAAELPATSFESDPTMQTEALTRLGLTTMTTRRADGTHELRVFPTREAAKDCVWAERIEPAYDSATGARHDRYFDRNGDGVVLRSPSHEVVGERYMQDPQPSDALRFAILADGAADNDLPCHEGENPPVRLDLAQRILRANLTEDDLRGQMAERRDEIDDARARHDRELMIDALRSCAMDALSDAEARQAADSTDRPLF